MRIRFLVLGVSLWPSSAAQGVISRYYFQLWKLSCFVFEVGFAVGILMLQVDSLVLWIYELKRRDELKERKWGLTSSTHCMCWSLRATSRAVSPAEFTVGDVKEDMVQVFTSCIGWNRVKKELKVPVCRAAFALSSNLRDSGLWCRTL